MPFFHRLLMAFDITDELFRNYDRETGVPKPWYMYGAIALALPGWAVGTALGALAGNLMPWRLVSAFSVALYGMFLAIIIPPARKSRILAGSLSPSASRQATLRSICRGISSISSGTRTIILTVVLSSAAAILFPHPAEDSADTSRRKQARKKSILILQTRSKTGRLNKKENF